MRQRPKNKKEMIRATRARIVLRVLKRIYPNPQIALQYKNRWELLVAVVLSAQCTDKKVNEVTKHLFKKYRTLRAYTTADPQEFEQDIFQTGFYRAKTKNILAGAKMVQTVFQGQVPGTMAELVTIPGVGRKTANVILSEAFGISEGIAVDTHVMRLARKFGLTTAHDPKKIEADLMKSIPKKEWLRFTHRMIQYGRDYSPARKVRDESDPISIALKKI